jgi:hypothetical protein
MLGRFLGHGGLSETKEASTESALLLLLRMKRDLLSLHLLDQSLDSIKHCLIGDAGRHETVMLDLAVEFGALLTHGNSAFARAGSQHWLLFR